MKLSIVIPNYNGEELLKNNLPKVLEAVSKSKVNFEIIISDDNSTDNSIKIIEEFIDNNKEAKVKLVKGSENKGFSTNVNRAVGVAKGELLLLLNTDVIPSIGFTENILPYFNNENIFAVGCMDESVESERVVKRGRGNGIWKRGFLHHGAAPNESGETLWVAGGSGFFRKKIWDELSGLDTLFDPFYWEDIDISYRARKAGFKTFFEKNSIVRHEHEKGSIKSKFSDKQIKSIAYRNQFIFAWKNSDFTTLISGIFWLPYHLLKAIFSKDIAFINGLYSALVKAPGVLRSRMKAQKLFVLSDKEVTSLS